MSDLPPAIPAPRRVGLAQGSRGREVAALQGYLARFGYLGRDRLRAVATEARFDAATDRALRRYQEFFHLEVTGTLTDETVELMALPRCGVPDVVPEGEPRTFVAQGSRWPTRNLKYAFSSYGNELSAAAVEAATAEAFALWAAQTTLTFTKVAPNQSPDILILFGVGEHIPGCTFGGELAHAYYPPPAGGSLAGDSHFNDQYVWTLSGGPDIDYTTVAAHEFGHALGLDHSQVESAMMWPYYLGPRRFLDPDDAAGIRAVYMPAPVATATPLSTSAIRVAWNAVAGATSYQVFSSATAGGVYTVLPGSPTSGTFLDHTGLPPNATRHYYVQASDGSQTIDSQTVSATTQSQSEPFPEPVGPRVGRHTYRVIMVSRTGGDSVELVRAQVQKITWQLNHWGEATYRLSTLDLQAAEAKLLLEREVQIWRDGVLVFWGIPVGYQADLASVTFTAFGLLWYFARRFFGPVYSNATPPMMRNGNFEAPTLSPHWDSSSPAPGIALTTGHRYTGTQSVKLTGGGNPEELYYIYQFEFLPSPARTQPYEVTMSAWCYPENVTVWGYEDRGIEIQLNNGAPADQLPQEWALLNANVPQNRWSRLETKLLVPAGSTDSCTVALFAPAAGSVYYDQVRFSYEQRTGALEGQDWVDDYLRRIFNYGAGLSGGGSSGPGGSLTGTNAWWGAPASSWKSNLGMNFFPSMFAAGSLTADTYWDHEDGGNIYQAMSEVFKRDRADFEITWNRAGTTRGLTPYVPRKGAIKRALALELGRNITKFSYDVDGRQSANDVRMVGRSTGDTKEVGQAGGPFPSTLGGVQYEMVEAPPQETDGQGLIDMAVAEERRLRAPVVVPTITAKADGLLDATNVGGPLTVGDVVPVRLDYGIIQENDLRRVVKMTLSPETESLDLVLNAVV